MCLLKAARRSASVTVMVESEMLEKGILERRTYKVIHGIKLEMLLDALDARFLSYGGGCAEDLAEMILRGLDINADRPEVVEAYVIGFRSGQVASESGAERMDLGCRLMEYSAVGEHKDEEDE